MNNIHDHSKLIIFHSFAYQIQENVDSFSVSHNPNKDRSDFHGNYMGAKCSCCMVAAWFTLLVSSSCVNKTIISEVD